MLNLVHPPKSNGKPTAEQMLHAQLQQQAQQLSQLAGILCALLKEKHQGRAFLAMSSLGELANWQVNFQPLPELGTMRLQLLTPNGQPFAPAVEQEKPAVSENALPTEAAKVVTETAPSAPCASDWHKDGIGLRCPDCGSIERVTA